MPKLFTKRQFTAGFALLIFVVAAAGLFGSMAIMASQGDASGPGKRPTRIEVLSSAQRKVMRLWVADQRSGSCLAYWTGAFPDLHADGYPDSLPLEKGHSYFLNAAVSDRELGLAVVGPGPGNWHWGNDIHDPLAPRVLADGRRLESVAVDAKGHQALVLAVGDDGALRY